MALNIKDPDLLRKIEHLSRTRRTSKVDVLRAALDAEIERDASRKTIRERLAPLLAKAASLGTPSRMSVDDHKKASDSEWGED